MLLSRVLRPKKDWQIQTGPQLSAPNLKVWTLFSTETASVGQNMLDTAGIR